MNKGTIRLACCECDRNDHDGIRHLPSDWHDIEWYQSYEDSIKTYDLDEKMPEDWSVLDWHTHIGTCPDCAAEQEAEFRLQMRTRQHERRQAEAKVTRVRDLYHRLVTCATRVSCNARGRQSGEQGEQLMDEAIAAVATLKVRMLETCETLEGIEVQIRHLGRRS